LAVDRAWLKEMIELAKADRDSALAKVAAAPISPQEKQGVALALKGIFAFEQIRDNSQPNPYPDQLEKIRDGVLVGEVDRAYAATWLSFAGELPVRVEEGHVKAEEHEPEDEESAKPLGVQLPLTAYPFANEGASHEDAEKVEDN
jgi:hypothetical protein